MGDERRFHAPLAWIGGGWSREVLLRVDGRGCWSGLQAGVPRAEAGDALVLPGPVLPGLVNAHSHAFQRAIAGLTERCADGEDDFWRWRERMYAVALRISPRQLEAVAGLLYAEMLAAGYTQVCEFHYLHRDPAGQPYADAGEMGQALRRAARAAGIGLTLLPTLYMRSGFGATGLRENQRRFAADLPWLLRTAEELAPRDGGVLDATGLALHSLRAVEEGAVAELGAALGRHQPMHIHVSEQRQEVEDCLARHGRRPIEWLLAHAPVDERWNLVHATQADAGELRDARQRGAAIVLCPSTEANLGDGVFDLPSWLGASGRWSIGSDSHVCRDWQEELRLLEYSQRFALRRRNVAAQAAVSESTAAALFQGALEGGSAAAGLPLGGLATGQRADFMVLDPDAPALAGMPETHLLDALVFSSPGSRPLQVYVAGERRLPDPASHRAGAAAIRALTGA